MPAQRNRLEVAKTYKLYIGGKYPRSESGRTVDVTDKKGTPYANIAWASRKDTRDAVSAARKAFGAWSDTTAYLRGQIAYRVAEMLEGRHDQFVEELTALGATPAQARSEVNDAIDTWVYYAGFADKYAQVLGCANPVAASYFNFSLPEPMGVVALVVPDDKPLLSMSQMLAPALVGANTSVVIAPESNPAVAISFAEVLSSSDVPGGVVNILTSYREELAPVLASHMDVNAIDLRGIEDPAFRGSLEKDAVANLKRVTCSHAPADIGTVEAIEQFQEIKTVWHPVGV